jgi:hypothetical protein
MSDQSLAIGQDQAEVDREMLTDRAPPVKRPRLPELHRTIQDQGKVLPVGESALDCC